MNMQALLALGPGIVLVAVLTRLIPSYRKRSLYFGITVDPQFPSSAAGRAIARAYRAGVWAAAVLALLLLALSVPLWLVPLVQIAVVAGLWVFARGRTRPFAAAPSTVRSARLAGRDDARLPGPVLFLLPLLTPLMSAMVLAMNYDALPERFPVHWGVSGPDRFLSKSVVVVFSTPVLSGLVLLLLAALGLAIRYRSRRGSTGERPGWSANYLRLNLRLLVAVTWCTAVLMAAVSIGPAASTRVVGTVIAVLVVALLGALIVYGWPLIRMSWEPTGGSDATPDDSWHLGMFYYNPSDAALMVERRDGPGYTLNFAHKLSWAIAALALSPLAVAILVSLA